MASPRWKHDALVEALERSAARFGFFRAVQLARTLSPDAAPVGELGPPQEEAVRFRHDPSLVFHTSDIAGLRVTRDGDRGTRVELTTTFFGLVGAVSPLASAFSEEVLWAQAQDEGSLREFYDVFHHRLLSLLFRCWNKYRFAAAFRADAGDAFSRRMLAFVGVDLGEGPPARGLGRFDLLALAPLVFGRTRPARALQIVLEQLVPGARVAVEPFVERRVQIPEDQRCRAGMRNCTLGVDFAVGRTVADRCGRFRVTIGPVDYDTFDALVPGGRDHARLRDVVLQLSPAHVEPELELLLGAGESPRFRLGAERGGRLGVTTRLPASGSGDMRARVVLGGVSAGVVLVGGDGRG